MVARAVLKTSYWPAEAGQVRDITVCETLYHAAATVPGRLALVDCVPDAAARRQWTYAEFVAVAEQAARALLARFSPGERIAIWAPNSAEWVILQQGISLAGMVLVALNPAYRTREMQFVLARARSAPTPTGADSWAWPRPRSSLPGLREIVSLATGTSSWPRRPRRGRGGDMIQVQYTSGTTGLPRGAMLHHMGLVNEATFVAERAGMGDGGVCVNAMPMYHIGGGAVTSFGTWAKRGTFVILPGFEPGLLLEAFEAYSGTHALVVPTMLIAMLDHPDLAKRDLSSLQTIMSGAASVPASLVRKTIGLLGCQFSILFGQTETHGVISQTRVTDTPEDQADTVGQPLPRLEVKIADMATDEPVPVNEQGEICCRGYQNMQGYYNMPAETAATIDGDGWLHMGDIGSMDERGFLRVTGRVKDMIIRGGMNLYPAEIEAVLQDHPAIETAAVIGVPDEKWGEQVAAVLRLRADFARPTAAELTEFLRDQIAAHKIPVFWTFVDGLPMTPTGKTQKYVLRQRAADGTLTFDEVRPPRSLSQAQS